MKDIKKQIEKESLEQFPKNDFYGNVDPWNKMARNGFESGAKFILDKQDEMLFDFFLWFRENGEKYIEKSIENMIDIYLTEK